MLKFPESAYLAKIFIPKFRSPPLPYIPQTPAASRQRSPPRLHRPQRPPGSAASDSPPSALHPPRPPAPPATGPHPASPAAPASAPPASTPAPDRSAESESPSPLPLQTGSLPPLPLPDGPPSAGTHTPHSESPAARIPARLPSACRPKPQSSRGTPLHSSRFRSSAPRHNTNQPADRLFAAPRTHTQ